MSQPAGEVSLQRHTFASSDVEEVTVAGVGLRALQYAFQRHLDTTPTAYLRRVRLEGARRELQGSDPQRGATVGAIAARWGLGKSDHFAPSYQGRVRRAAQSHPASLRGA